MLAELGLQGLADVSICTFSKAAGAVGGAVCASQLFCDGLVNFGRAYIYSTAVPTWVAKAASQAIAIMRDEPWRQRRLRALALNVRSRLAAAGASVVEGDSPIVPIVLGDEQTATAAAEKLLEKGIFVTAIRPPTVAAGTSRLRLTLSSEHTDAEIEMLLIALREVQRGVELKSAGGAVHPAPIAS